MLLLDGDAEYFPQSDLGADSRELLAALLAQVPWRQDEVTLFGKTHLQPRLTAWVGDADCAYGYSGLQLDPLPWTPLLTGLRAAMERVSGARFNSVLLNHYRSGADSMGLHADDEAELGPRPVIASLSLGATRAMIFKSRTDPAAPTVRLPLGDGSVLIMRGQCQRRWKHGIARTRRVLGPRVNLTFRWIIPQSQRHNHQRR